jgi:drug/metabolite transporter (DMT)-like permease
MTALALVAAVAAALCYAVAAALEQIQAEADRGRDVVRSFLLWRLMHQRRWLLGFGIGGLGAGLHLLAVALAPLALVQPIVVLTVVFAVPLGAALRRRRPTKTEMVAAIAVAAGLAIVVTTVRTTAEVPRPAGGSVALAAVVVATCVTLILLVAARVSGSARTVLLAGAAAALLGLGSALARTLLASDLSWATIVAWGTPLLAGCAIAGTSLEQTAYKSGRLAVTVAVMTVVDPLVAIGIGAGALGQPVRFTMPAITALAAAMVVTGVITLARHTFPPVPAAQPEPARRVVVPVGATR